MSAPGVPTTGGAPLEAESRAWVDRLDPQTPQREGAIEALHALLVKGACFEVNRRRTVFPRLRGDDHEDLAHQPPTRSLPWWASSATSATTGASPPGPTTPPCSRRRSRSAAAPGRDARCRSSRSWALIADGDSTPHQDAETSELFAVLQHAIVRELSPHQREVLVGVTLNDVLSLQLNTARGALYKAIHDAGRKLRAALSTRGLGGGENTGAATP